MTTIEPGLPEKLPAFRGHLYYGDDFTVECPTGSGQYLTLNEVAIVLSRLLACIFPRDDQGCRAVFEENALFQSDPHRRDLIPFHEYFHGDNDRGVGASHQTGGTALVAKLPDPEGRHRRAMPMRRLEAITV